jgi:hypothetical protein
MAVAPVVAAFFLIPFVLYYNAREYWNWDWGIPADFATIGMLLCLPLIFIIWVLSRIRPRVAARVSVFLFCLGLFVLLADVYSPLQSTPLDGSELSSSEPVKHTLIEAGILMLILLVVFKRRRTLTSIAAPVSAVLLLVALVYCGLILSASRPVFVDNREVDPSIKGNVYHILLDEMQTDAALLYMREGELEEDFRGFTVFEDNVANYSGTGASLPSYLTGTLYSGGSFRQWTASHRYIGLFRDMSEKGYAGFFYGASGWSVKFMPCVTYDDTYRKHAGRKSSRSRDFVQIWLARIVPNFLAQEAFDAGRRLSEATRPTTAIPGTVAEGRHVYSSVLMLRQLIEEEELKSPDGRYTYLHMILPHFPFVMTESGEYDIDLRSTGASGYYGQVGCALNLVTEFLDELKRLERYDASTIIIHGDTGHGKLGFINKTPEGVEATADSQEEKAEGAFAPEIVSWTEQQVRARAKALLMIKPARADGPVSFSARQSQLLDIYPTMKELLGLAREGTGVTEGLDLFGEEFPADRAAEFFLYPENDHEPYDIKRITIHDSRNLSMSKLTVSDYVNHYSPATFPARGMRYDIGSYREGRLQLTGFSTKERESKAEGGVRFRWATGKRSKIVFRGVTLPRKSRLRVTFVVEPHAVNESKQMIIGTGSDTSRVGLKKGWNKYSVVLKFPAGDDLFMDMQYADSATASQRDVSVRWNTISLAYEESGNTRVPE